MTKGEERIIQAAQAWAQMMRLNSEEITPAYRARQEVNLLNAVDQEIEERGR